MSNWKKYFDDEQLLYGHEDYEWDRYENLCRIDDTVFATVLGNDDYTVRITLVNDEISSMSCTCPHAMKGNNCKHMACICYYIEKNDIRKVETSTEQLDLFRDTISDEEFKTYLVSRMNTLKKDEIIELFSDIIMNNQEYYSNDFIYYLDNISYEDKLVYKKRLNNILVQEIDIIDSHQFTDKLDKFIHNELFIISLLEEYSLFFELIRSILLRLATINYVRDTFEFEILISNLKFDIDELIEYDEVYRNKINKLFIQISDEYSDTVFIESFNELFNNYVESDNKEIQIRLLKKEIEKQTIIYINQIEDIVKLMEEADYTTDDIIKFLEAHPDVTDIELLLSKYYLKNDRIDDAKKILRESCVENPYSIRSQNALEELKKIYLENNDEEYINCIHDLIFKYNHYSHENIILLKEYYKKDWPSKEKEILSHYKNTLNINDNYYNYLLDKEDYESFKKSIFSHGDYDDLLEFEKILLDKYPTELLDAYEKIVYKIMEESKVKNYKDAVKILKKMNNIPEGNLRVNIITDKLIDMYPRRSRMIKELKTIKSE